MLYLFLSVCCVVLCNPLFAAHQSLDLSPIQPFIHKYVETVHYQKRSSPRILNKIPVEEQPNAAPYITQEIGTSPHVDFVTNITFSNVYEMLVDGISTATFNQYYDECVRVIAQLKQERSPCGVIMHVQYGALNRDLGKKLLMKCIYKTDESETLYLIL